MSNSNVLQLGLLLILLLPLLKTNVHAVPKHYIVYLGSHDGGRPLQGDPEDVTRSHLDMISFASNMSNNNGLNPAEKLIYSYTNIFNAFAATLHEEEADELAKHSNVISIFENRDIVALTTNSWDFLSSFEHQNAVTNGTLGEKASNGENIIIGGLDSGVWPESQSFSDKGYGDIPKRFKGQCNNEHDPAFKCNRKLIGARYFSKGLEELLKSKNLTPLANPSPRDIQGHGTHTLSIAGGNIVPNAESITLRILGVKNATVRGGAPRARVIAYKVLWREKEKELMGLGFGGNGASIDMLSAIEAAIGDGVHIINFSIGSSVANLLAKANIPDEMIGSYYFEDVISIGTFHAMMNGVLVVASGGNDGPIPSSIANIPPWLLTVGSSTLDREFKCNVTLGNHQSIKATRYIDKPSVAEMLMPEQTKNNVKVNETTFFPLITGADSQFTGANPTNASYCMDGSIDPAKVNGKILVCLLEKPGGLTEIKAKSNLAEEAGAVGLILANDHDVGSRLLPDFHSSPPTAHMIYKDGQTLLSYIKSTRNPVASISNMRTELDASPAPIVSDFSSRGPNPVTPNILKPDVIAPGSNILAAYSEASDATFYPDKFQTQSGTSMSAPHVAGIAALLRKLHPHWSTSAIKSAIMTTARPLDKNEKAIREDDLVHEATPFAIGAGLMQPNLAMDPGLVYDMNHYDYLNFLCAQNYNDTIIKMFTAQHAYKCPKSFSLNDFNYPSISVTDFSGTVTVTRKLKNVGQPGTYTARLEAPHGVSIVVEPKTLVYTKKDQLITFKLIISATKAKQVSTDYSFGSLIWSDGNHVVRSPIVIKGKA